MSCVKIECAGGINAKETEAVQVRSPTQDTKANEAQNAEGKREADNEGEVVYVIAHCRGWQSSWCYCNTGIGCRP